MKEAVTVCLVQCDAVLGDVEKNLAQHLARIAEARAQGAGLVVFPELSLTGYLLRDLTADVALSLEDPRLVPLAEASRSLDVVAGLIEEGPDHRPFNAAVYWSGGRVVHVHRKIYLPTYSMFEEGRYWAPGSVVGAFDTRFGRVGLLTCEDAWHPSTSYLLFADGAEIVLTPSASPARGVQPQDSEDDGAMLFGSTRTWDGLLRHQSAAYNMFSVYVNRAGVEDGTTFSGNSRVVDPFGRVLLELGLAPQTALCRLEPELLRRRRLAAPMLRDERLDVTLGNLERIARDRFQR